MTTRTTRIKHEKDFHHALEQWSVDNPQSNECLRALSTSTRPVNDERSARALGIELFRSLAATTRIFEVLADHHLQSAGLSAPRFRLLVWLHVEELRGNKQGISPSRLSHFQHVSKNTVSSLLASLEDQGLIERTLSREDKRKFSIRLSKGGRELMCSILPQHSGFVRDTLSALSVQEQATLVTLLHKLRQTLVEKASRDGLDYHEPTKEDLK